MCYIYKLRPSHPTVLNLLTYTLFQCDNYIAFNPIASYALQMHHFEMPITLFQTFYLLQSFL
ncbi:hypothetical protein LaLC_23700 [Bacillus anthracis]|uniref:Uncharacterized protein n=1 Tax=Bacillus anthracis TaxID=1392 RepID=A0A640MGU8_BACAN|nr:hypothetical protein LaLC_23700 [Bacillus anthracis]